jgi:hypothetical protein
MNLYIAYEPSNGKLVITEIIVEAIIAPPLATEFCCTYYYNYDRTMVVGGKGKT